MVKITVRCRLQEVMFAEVWEPSSLYSFPRILWKSDTFFFLWNTKGMRMVRLVELRNIDCQNFSHGNGDRVAIRLRSGCRMEDNSSHTNIRRSF